MNKVEQIQLISDQKKTDTWDTDEREELILVGVLSIAWQNNEQGWQNPEAYFEENYGLSPILVGKLALALNQCVKDGFISKSSGKSKIYRLTEAGFYRRAEITRKITGPYDKDGEDSF